MLRGVQCDVRRERGWVVSRRVWVRFGRGGKVPVRERGWKFSLVL